MEAGTGGFVGRRRGEHDRRGRDDASQVLHERVVPRHQRRSADQPPGRRVRVGRHLDADGRHLPANQRLRIGVQAVVKAGVARMKKYIETVYND